MTTEKIIWLTGSGTGIGRASAMALATPGNRLILTGRRTEPLEETATLCRQANAKAAVEIAPGDLSKIEIAQAIVADIVKRHGRLDVVVGVRLESSSQEVGTFVPFSPTAESIGADLSTLDVLPSLVVSWEPVDGHFVRGGLARTGGGVRSLAHRTEPAALSLSGRYERDAVPALHRVRRGAAAVRRAAAPA